MVNRTPQLKNLPGRQVSAMGRGGGRGPGTDRGGRDGRAGRGGRRYDSGRGHERRGNDCGRRGERSSNPHIYLLWPQNLVLKLSNLDNPTVYYICFQLVPLRLIFLLGVSYKIWFKIGLFIPFYPQFSRLG